MLLFALVWSAKDDWNWDGGNGAELHVVDACRSARTGRIGGVFLLGFGSLLLGVVLMIIWRVMRPAFFRGEILNHDSPTLVPDVADAELAATLAASSVHAQHQPTDPRRSSAQAMLLMTCLMRV